MIADIRKSKELENLYTTVYCFDKKAIATADSKYSISARWSNTIRIWNFEKNLQEAVLDSSCENIVTIAVPYNYRYIVIGGNSGLIEVWGFLERVRRSNPNAHSGEISSIAIAHKCYFISAGSEGKYITWKYEEF